MKPRTKDKLQLIGFSVVYWMIASVLFHILRRVGMGGEFGIEFVIPISLWEGFRVSLFTGMVSGICYGLIELAFDNSWMRRRTIGTKLFVKTVVYTFLIVFVITAAVNYVNFVIDPAEDMTRSRILGSGAIWSIITFFIVSSSLFSFLRLVNEKFGPGVLWKMLLGKYQKPRVEKKIFMFLDLKSSTSIAEELGFERYSSLIQQCFYDLNEVISGRSAEIYQYVGDEAVLCWDYEKGVQGNECIDLYFAFLGKVHSKRDFYMQEFGLIPEFKAGLHGGELMVAEVGVVKKEIAYHGDVINTTARIQSMCNELQAPLLISGSLLSALSLSSSFSQKFEGEFTLKGKEASTGLHRIELS